MKQSEENAFPSDIFALLTVEVGTPLGVLIYLSLSLSLSLSPSPSPPSVQQVIPRHLYPEEGDLGVLHECAHTHTCTCTHTLLPLPVSYPGYGKKLQACCSPKNKTNLKKVYWLHCSTVILIPKTKNEKKRNIFSRERSLEWVKTQLSSFNLTLSEWCDLGWDIFSLETLVSVIVICSVWSSSSLTVFSSLKVYCWQQC